MCPMFFLICRAQQQYYKLFLFGREPILYAPLWELSAQLTEKVRFYQTLTSLRLQHKPHKPYPMFGKKISTKFNYKFNPHTDQSVNRVGVMHISAVWF